MKGRSRFVVPILPDENGDYHLAVFIAFEGDLDLKYLIECFNGNVNANGIDGASIVGYATWDSDDQEKKYPGTRSLPWGW
jgi:hypothetical protein